MQKNRYFWATLLILILGCLQKLNILPPIENGQDAVSKWLMMKSLWLNAENTYWHWSHHTARWGMNIWIILVTKIFGAHPNSYYILPLLAYLVSIYYIFKIGILLFKDNRALIAPILFIFFAQYERNAVQLIPAVFSNAYVTSSYYFLLIYLEKKPRLKILLLSIVLFFLAYLTKLPNLFFLPGFFLTIYFYKKDLKHIILYGLPLFALYLGETLTYFLFTEFKFGRLQIILGNHMKGPKLVEVPFKYLFQRFRNAHTPLGQYLYLFFMIFPFFIWKFKTKAKLIQGLFVTTFIFYFLKAFVQKGYNPIILIEPFNERYLLAGVPLLLICLISYLPNKIGNKIVNLDIRKITITLGVVCFGYFISNSIQLIKGEHRFNQNIKEVALFNKAYSAGIPIITNDYHKNLYNVYRVFLSDENTVVNGKYVPVQNQVERFYVGEDRSEKNMRNILLKSPEIRNFTYSEKIWEQCHIYVQDNLRILKEVNCQK